MDKWGKQLLRICNHTCKYVVPFGPLTNPQSWERDTTAPTLQIRKQVQKVKPSAELNSWKVEELGFESGLCDSKQEPFPYNMLPHKYYSITTNIIAIVIITFIPYKFGKWKAETGEEDGRGTQCTQGKPGKQVVLPGAWLTPSPSVQSSSPPAPSARSPSLLQPHRHPASLQSSSVSQKKAAVKGSWLDLLVFLPSFNVQQAHL